MTPVRHGPTHIGAPAGGLHLPAHARHAPGVFDLKGTMGGEIALIAYDRSGECTIRLGDSAFGELSHWLAARGVLLDRPVLGLI